eukprot:Phypoly_transcript_00729.p1 GENE.Phypoly_transcript_00729~~Phypoly_transcript_00729.p1  ORF type:complete len:1185 (+),score=285.31 Phypoly_transcript_00729:47-3601(+)
MASESRDQRVKSVSLGHVSKWDNIQSDRFTLWANHYLQKKGLAVKDLSDFSDGVLLLNLLEAVSGKNVPRFIKNPRFLQQKIENITIALGFIERNLDIKVFGCNAKDIVDGNLKQILGIIFLLIQKSKETGDDVLAASTPTKPKQVVEPHMQSPARAVDASSPAKAEPADSTKSAEPEPAPVTTAIPITQETAPFTPKVHRPRVGTMDMLSAMSPESKHLSFIAKQEFFEKKDQETRDKQRALNTRPHSMIAPKSEFGVPVMLINKGKEDGLESPRSDAQTPRSDAVLSPRSETPLSDAVLSPRSDAQTPRSEPTTPRSSVKFQIEEEPARPIEEKSTEDKKVEKEEKEVPVTPEVTIIEPEPEPKGPEEPKEPTEPKEPGQPTPEKARDELTPEQVKKEEKQKKKDLRKEKKRLSDLRRKEKRKSGAEGDFVEKSDSTLDLQKGAEDGEEKIEIFVSEEVVVKLQTFIRASMGRVEYARALSEIAQRKKELLDAVSTNPTALRGMLRVQAVFRGRVTRIRVRREAQVYRRNEIAKEILNTEKKYVQNLDVLVELFLEPLKKMLTPQQIRQIFSNIEVIRGYNKTLLTRLDARMQVWYSKGQCLGDIFVEVTEFLKVYTTYVNNYNTSIAIMTECMENPKFSAFIEKMRSASECNGLSFASFLIQPIQRLPRYVLLLQDLLKYTTAKHADYAQLSKALQKMKDVADYVNERKREAENLTQVLAIQAKLTGKFENLAEPHRRYVRRGILAMFDEKANMKSFFFFLFNDTLVYTDYKNQSRLFRGSFGRQNQAAWDEQAFNNGKFKYVGNFPLQALGAGVADVPDAEKDRVQFAFQLITPTTSTLLMANTQDEKVAWMNDLDECIYALLEKERSRKITQLTDDPQSSWLSKVTVSTALEDGDYTGYIFKKANNNSWKQRYFLLRKGMLYYFPEKPPGDAKEYPARVISLVWCSVKVGQILDRGAVFQLATPARIIFLSSPDLRTMFQWIYVIRLAIAGQIQLLGDDETETVGDKVIITDRFEPVLEPPTSPTLANTSFSSLGSIPSNPGTPVQHDRNSLNGSATSTPISRNSLNGSATSTPTSSSTYSANTSMQDLQELLQQPENQVCADCGAPGASWIHTSHGVFLCVSCSGIHRRLPSGSGLQSVRSLANRPDSVDLKTLGNAIANARFEKNVNPELKPAQNDP